MSPLESLENYANGWVLEGLVMLFQHTSISSKDKHAHVDDEEAAQPET